MARPDDCGRSRRLGSRPRAVGQRRLLGDIGADQPPLKTGTEGLPRGAALPRAVMNFVPIDCQAVTARRTLERPPPFRAHDDITMLRAQLGPFDSFFYMDADEYDFRAFSPITMTRRRCGGMPASFH